MTMPPVECSTYVPPANVRGIVLDRVRQRFQNLRQHSQKCLNQHQASQQTLRTNEKLQTSLLRQRLQENKVKKGKNCKLDAPRSKMAPINDDGDYALLRQPTKRKMADSLDNIGYTDMHGQQQDPKRMKPDTQQSLNNNQDFSQLSVQIVANYGNGTPTDQIKVNFQANRNGSDKDSVSVKVEQDHSRRGQPQTQNRMSQHPNMRQESCPQPTDVNEANSFGGNLSESEAFSRDIDDIMEFMNEFVQEQPTPMPPPPPPPQQMTPPSYPLMTSSQNFPTQQSNQQYLVTSQSPMPQAQRPMYSHMTSSGQTMTQPMMQQHQQANQARACKSEKTEMFNMYRRMPENKPENPGIQRQNSHGIPHPNMGASIMTQQAVQFAGNGFAASVSSQQNVSMNMMRQTPNNYPPTMTRQMSSNNNNMTSQHIHRLSQVAHFSTQDAPQHEPPRLFHPPAQNPYESSAHLRHIAEKNRHERSRPMNLPTDPRTTQAMQHYHNDGPNMTQQMNMMNHPISTGSQRLSHMDANMYSRSQQYMQSQQRPGIAMQQSMQQESIMMRQYPVPQAQPPTYNRAPEPHPQHVIPANQTGYPGNNGNPQQSWNRWQQVTPHNPMHHHRPQITPDQMQRPHMNSTVSTSNYLPELDNDLKLIEEIFNDR